MTLVLNETYPGKTAGATLDYPYGKAKNVSAPGNGDGTPWDESLVNDLIGFHQAALLKANIIPNGQPDTAKNSQVLTALISIFTSTFLSKLKRKWEVVTDLREFNAEYENETDLEMDVAITFAATNAREIITVKVDDVVVFDKLDMGTDSWIMPILFSVPPGAKYKVEADTRYTFKRHWSEFKSVL